MTPDPEEDVDDPLGRPPEPESQSVAEDPDTVRAKAAERDEYLDRLKRTMAEFQNYKQRVGREKTDLRKFVTAEVVRAFLPVLDNLERAVAAAKDETARGPRPSAAKAGVEDPLLDGVRMVIGEFHRRLEQLGVKPVQTTGARFDPSQMEAVLRVDDREADENSVLDVFEKGYRLDDFVIRHARVSVAARSQEPGRTGPKGPRKTERADLRLRVRRVRQTPRGASTAMSDPPLKKCPKCGKRRLSRLIGAGAGVIFKGCGFYTTDYRSSSYDASKKSDSEAPATSPTRSPTRRPRRRAKPAGATDGGQSTPTPAPSKKSKGSKK